MMIIIIWPLVYIMLLFYKSNNPVESVGYNDLTMGNECTHGKRGLLLKFKPIVWPLTSYCFNKSSNNNESQCHEKKDKKSWLYIIIIVWICMVLNVMILNFNSTQYRLVVCLLF